MSEITTPQPDKSSMRAGESGRDPQRSPTASEGGADRKSVDSVRRENELLLNALLERVDDFAEHVQPYYAVADWRWLDKPTPPTSADIAATIRNLVYHMRARGSVVCETGGMRIRIDDGEASIEFVDAVSVSRRGVAEFQSYPDPKPSNVYPALIAERDALRAALVDLREACRGPYSRGLVAAEAFIASGNVLDDVARHLLSSCPATGEGH